MLKSSSCLWYEHQCSGLHNHHQETSGTGTVDDLHQLSLSFSLKELI